MKRFQLRQDKSLGERLIAEAKLAREKAEQLPAGEERKALLKKARQAETQADIDKWLDSSGLRPPE
ncbi:MAG TPA: hypothetical protein VKY22_03970 [Bradyrhizobium sp.]|nr:hypothetical protein [Bradyrhizobium sp.]